MNVQVTPGKVIAVAVAIPCLLWGYGFVRGWFDVNSGDYNLLTLAFTAHSMNSISASGYKAGCRTNDQFVRRVDGMNEDMKQLQRSLEDLERATDEFGRSMESLGR